MTGSDMISREVAILLYILVGIGFVLLCTYEIVFGWVRDKIATLLKSVFSSRPKEMEPTLRTRRVGRS